MANDICSQPLTTCRVGADGAPHPRNWATAGHRLLVLLAVALYVVVLVRTAWLCDDSYIALRTVDNFVNGRGLTWNVDERVQTFTCPLWVLLLSAVYYVTREPFYTTIGVSLACSVATIGVMVRHGLRQGGAIVLAVTVLTCSKAFTDFSTSGLENPLTNLLLVSVLAVYLEQSTKRDRAPKKRRFAADFLSHGATAIRFCQPLLERLTSPEPTGVRRLLVLSLLASLAAINRLDTILIVSPLVAAAWWQRRSWAATWVLLIGFSPLAAWLGFATFYYGFAFPNTAYAKLHAGIPVLSLVWQGFYYYVNSLTCDPVTLAAIVMTLFVAAGTGVRHASLVAAGRRGLTIESDALSEWWKYLAVATGIALYLVYIVRIGGDFMSGRFFAAPLLASCALFATATRRWPAWLTAGLTVVTLALGAWPSCAPLRSGSDYGWPDVRDAVASGVWKAPLYDEHGIADERAFYYGGCGLLRAPCDRPFPTYDFEQDGRTDRARAADTPIVVCACVGIRGFYGGPDVHYVDTLALGDPLLSKLPARDGDKARVGHWERALPGGYLETLKTGENRLEDPRLKVYYDRLRIVSRGDLFDAERIREVARMTRGRYNVLLVDQPRVPPR